MYRVTRLRERSVLIPLRPDQLQFIRVDVQDYETLRKHSWSRSSSGDYAAARIEGRMWLMHRFILNAQPGQIVDHINGNTFDNRKRNLRLVSPKQNAQNSRMHRDNAVGYKGVHEASEGVFVAKIINGYLGSFDDPRKAGACYNRAARERFGAFAALNDISLEEESLLLSEAETGRRVKRSRFRGVSHAGVDVCCRWRATIRIGGKDQRLGCFENEWEAALAYDEAVKRLDAANRRRRRNFSDRSLSRLKFRIQNGYQC